MRKSSAKSAGGKMMRERELICHNAYVLIYNNAYVLIYHDTYVPIYHDADVIVGTEVLLSKNPFIQQHIFSSTAIFIP